MNYRDLLNIRYSFKYYIVIIVLIFIILIGYLSNKTITDVYKTVGYVDNTKLILNIPLEYSDTLNKLVYIKVDNDRYYIDDLIISNILLDPESLINYQEVYITPKNTYKENMLMQITIYYNEEKVFTKLWKLLF